jgi:hypothetical protein
LKKIAEKLNSFRIAVTPAEALLEAISMIHASLHKE